MSLEITVYTKQLSDEYILEIVKRLNEFEMDCEADPNFSFNNHTGFLSFKYQLANPPFPILKDKELITGLEFYVSDFDIEQEKLKAKPRQSLIDKLFAKKQPDRPLFSPEIELRLKDCKKMISFVWHVVDSFELRFASLTSAILTELTNGVCTYPADDIWYDNKNFVEKTWQEIKEYETTLLKERDLKFHEFKGWNNSF